MEGVLLVVSTGFASGSIYGSTFALSTLLPSSQYGGLASYQEFRAHNLRHPRKNFVGLRRAPTSAKKNCTAIVAEVDTAT